MGFDIAGADLMGAVDDIAAAVDEVVVVVVAALRQEEERTVVVVVAAAAVAYDLVCGCPSGCYREIHRHFSCLEPRSLSSYL